MDEDAYLKLKRRLQDKTAILDAIEAQQRNHPGYCSELAAAMIDSELQLLKIESRRAWEGRMYRWYCMKPNSVAR